MQVFSRKNYLVEFSNLHGLRQKLLSRKIRLVFLHTVNDLQLIQYFYDGKVLTAAVGATVILQQLTLTM